MEVISRRIIYTTDAVESIHSILEKLQKEVFPNENALLKFLYLRIREFKPSGMMDPFAIGQLTLINS